MFTELAVTLKGNTYGNDRLSHCGILQIICSYIMRVIILLPNNEFLAFARVTNHVLSRPIYI